MDVKKLVMDKVDDIVEKIKNDKDFADDFQKDPVKALEGVLGVDLPDDQINALITAVKAKIGLGALGGLFGKK